ncbi:MAG: hypothetical protein Q4A60_06595 [Pasteurellaceae bacterium]|nr:hypothetical protein [Pasteurellaceae bacterium]
MKKIIQIIASGAGNQSVVIALCDDGTVWRYDNIAREWFQLPGIRQT